MMTSQHKQSYEKENIEKEEQEKEAEQNRILETRFFFGEGIRQGGNGIFGTILTTALPLIGEIVKAFKQKMRKKNYYIMRRLDASKKLLFPTVEHFMLNIKEYQGFISQLMLQ